MPIGSEILPNVYISNIEVYDKKINFSIMSLDSISAPVWSNKKFLKDTLQLKILCVVNDTALVDEITSGRVKINKFDKNVERFLLTELPSKDITTTGNYFNRHRVYLKKYSFHFNEHVEDLTVFANLFSERPNIEGPIASERIISEGKPSDQSIVFMKGDQQYYGAMHLHSDGYMEFAQHKQTPHSFLQDISVPNLKLKDFRQRKFETKDYQARDPISEFSELFVSFDKETDHNYMFFANIKELILKNTKYGGMLENYSPVDFFNILNSFSYRVLNVDRHKIKSYNKLTLGTRTERDLGKLIETKNIIMGTQNFLEIVLSRGKKMNFISHEYGLDVHGFYFEDELNDRSPGEYQYEIEFIFNDPTINIVRTYISDLKSIIERAEFYRSVLMRIGSYDHFLRMPNPIFETKISDPSSVALELSRLSNRYKSIIYKMSRQELENDLIRSYSFLNPKSCTPESVSIFIEEALLLLNKYISVFEVDNNVIKHSYEKPFLPRGRFRTNIINIKHRFKKVVVPMSSSIHYVYNTEEFEPSPPKSFGKRGMLLPFNIRSKDSKLKSFFNKAISNKKQKMPFFVKPFVKKATEKKEKYIESTRYLGKSTKFNSFESEEKCEVPEVSRVDEIQLGLSTEAGPTELNTVNKMEILSGFETTKDGRKQLKKPLWSSEPPRQRATTILKQIPAENRPEDIDFPFANEYVLLNNQNKLNQSRVEFVENSTDQASLYGVGIYQTLLTTNNVVANPPMTAIALESGVTEAAPRMETSPVTSSPVSTRSTTRTTMSNNVSTMPSPSTTSSGGY